MSRQHVLIGILIIVALGAGWFFVSAPAQDSTGVTAVETEESGDDQALEDQSGTTADEAETPVDAEVATPAGEDTGAAADASASAPRTQTTSQETDSTEPVEDVLVGFDSLVETSYDDSDLESFFEDDGVDSLTESYDI